KHYTDGDQIYRVYNEGYFDGEKQSYAVTTTPLAETLLKEYPEIIQSARIAPDLDEAGTNLVRTVQESLNNYEEGFLYVDPSFLKMFQFNMIHGDLTALERPFTIVLTASKAARFFPGENPLGKSLILNNNTERAFEVTGVIKDLPNNTHLNFDYLLSMQGVENAQVPNWKFGNFVTYIKVAEHTNIKDLESKMVDVIKQYKDPDYEESVAAGQHVWYRLQPIKDIHLKSAHIFGYWTHGNIQYVWLFGLIALFILLIASINFMNLSTARSANRAKEIGLRKVLGSQRGQLTNQFLVESILITVLAFSLAIVLSWILLPNFNQLTGSTLSIPWSNIWMYPMLLIGILGIGLLSGIYPSFFLSSFRPMQTLQGQLKSGKKGAGFRSALVVFQFTISIVLIVGSLVVKKQLDYIQSKQLGFDKEQVIILEDTYTINDQRASFKEELNQIIGIESVSFSSFIPVSGYQRNGTGAWLTGTNPEETGVNLAKWYVDYDYVKTLGLNILEGRDFSVDRKNDARQAIILNQRAVEMLGLRDPIGKQMTSQTFL
ncbi:MAG: ABC transporter permease, partial [Bacteroidota bacterium]